MSSFLFNNFKLSGFDGQFNLLTDTIKVILVGNANNANPDHTFVSNMTLAELNITGYTPGPGSSSRKTLANKTATKDDTNDRGVFDCDDVTWTGLNGGPAKAAIIYKHISGSDDSLNKLIAYIDDGGFPFTFASENFTIAINASGLFRQQ